MNHIFVQLKSSKGNASILLTFIFASMLVIISVLITASASSSGKSISDATLQLSGRSILSEYDRVMQDRYGLLAFRGDELDIQNKIDYYATASFSKNAPGYGLFKTGRKGLNTININLIDLNINLKEYTLLNVDHFEDQIVNDFAKSLITNVGNRGKVKTGEITVGRTLRNNGIIENLPSKGISDSVFPSFDKISEIPSMDNVLSSGSNKYKKAEYIFSVFKSGRLQSVEHDSFFNNEIEYILCGKKNDKENYDSTISKIKKIRFTSNSVYLITDATKMAEITKLAAPMAAAGGIGAVAAEAAIFLAWVNAETANDIKLLEEGEKVPLLKSVSSWATQDIAKIMEGTFGDRVVRPISNTGQDYKGYLRVLLFLADRETTLLRMMDLIQINLKGTYNKDFLIKEYYCGFRYSGKVKGDGFEYIQTY